MAQDAIGSMLQAWIDSGLGDRAIWHPAGGPLRVGDRRDVRPTGSLGRSIDWSVFEDARERGATRLGEAQLRRRPRFAARGVSQLWLERSRGSWALLVELEPPGRMNAEWMNLLALAMEAVECRGDGYATRPDRIPSALVQSEAAGLAHDVRHLLTLAGLELDAAGESDRRLAPARAALRSAVDLCGSTLSDEGVPVPIGRVPLRDLLRRAARAAARVSGRAASVAVTVEAAAEWELETDRTALLRLLGNLVLNAIQASPDGGEVRVVADRGPRGGWAISVDDRGRGMARDEVVALFDAGSSDGVGSGHGTTSVRECVARLDAEVRVETAPGEGTCVMLLLPDPERGPALLLVDRDRRRKSALANELRSRGWVVREASDPESARRLRRPGLTGVAVARGTPGGGLDALARAAWREGIPLALYGASEGTPAICAARIEATLPRSPIIRAGRVS